MRLLLYGLNYRPELVGIGPYTTGLAEGLVARGHEVAVVVGKPYYPEWRHREDEPRWRATHAIESGVAVTRCCLYVPHNPGGARRIAHHLSFGFGSLVQALRRGRRQRPDWVVAIAPSLLSLPVAWLTARASGARLWLHVQDFEVEAAFATGLVDPRGLAARLARGVERILFRLPDRFSSISSNMCLKLVAKGVPPERVIELRNWADERLASTPAGIEELRLRWDAGDRQIALYSGNIANKQGLEIVVEAAKLLSHRPDILIVICGDGANRQNLEALAAGLPNVQFDALQPRERLGDMLSAASVHLLPQLANTADLVLPSKLTNMLASGRPVVATCVPGTSLYDELGGCGVAVRPGDAVAFAAAIAALVDDAPRRRTMGAEALVRVAQRWRRDIVLDGFEAALVAAEPGQVEP